VRDRSRSSAGVACVVGARGRSTRISISLAASDRCAARSSPGAGRTSGRSASTPRADHPVVDERAGYGLCAQVSGTHRSGNTSIRWCQPRVPERIPDWRPHRAGHSGSNPRRMLRPAVHASLKPGTSGRGGIRGTTGWTGGRLCPRVGLLFQDPNCVTNCMTTASYTGAMPHTYADEHSAVTCGYTRVLWAAPLLDTEEVTGSIPVSPTTEWPGQRLR
jgi:hypothetical protein